MTEVAGWADSAQFRAQPHPNYSPTNGVMPKVHLLAMSPDPLGSIAAMSEMYKGNVVRDLADLTDEQRRSALADVQKTHLKAPLEAVKFHFLIDGVDRAFTAQLNRQRTAVYAEQSLRFAVIEDLEHGTSLPPSLIGTKPGDDDEERWEEGQTSGDIGYPQKWRYEWDDHMAETSRLYTKWVEEGMPSEDARGILPLSTATRTNYVTDLRNLSDHAGNRLCTQAQFHWRFVFNAIASEIRRYANHDGVRPEDEWQFSALVDSGLFRPVCYQLGHCPFKASFDRACSIRDRVDAFSAKGIPSEVWEAPVTVDGFPDNSMEPIGVAEWFLNPDAAR